MTKIRKRKARKDGAVRRPDGILVVPQADGTSHYRITCDAGRDPVTGRRKQVTRTYKLLREAKAEQARIGHQVRTGEYVARWDGTVNELCDDYLASALFEREANTAASYTDAFLPVRERLGHRKAQSVTRQDVEQLRDWMLTAGRRRGGPAGTGLGARSVRHTLGRLKAAFEQACDDGRCYRNPCRGVALPRQVRAGRATWSEEEARRFLEAAAGDRLHAAWRLSLYGARRGEVLGLRWEDIDLDAGTLRIGRARVLVGSTVIVKAPKSERGYRVLPLDPVLVAALRELHRRQAAERLAAGEAYQPSGYVVADELGVPVYPDGFTDEFHRLADLAGCPRIRLHDSRHTANSLMAAAGIPAHIRAAWCGHTTAINVTTYTHVRAEDLTQARDALARIYDLGAVAEKARV
jgi:integrase